MAYPPTGHEVTCFERSLRGTAGGVSLRVQFDTGAQPTTVSWRSRGAGAEELLTRAVDLDDVLSVNYFLTPTQDCVVGYEWSW